MGERVRLELGCQIEREQAALDWVEEAVGGGLEEDVELVLVEVDVLGNGVGVLEDLSVGREEDLQRRVGLVGASAVREGEARVTHFLDALVVAGEVLVPHPPQEGVLELDGDGRDVSVRDEVLAHPFYLAVRAVREEEARVDRETLACRNRRLQHQVLAPVEREYRIQLRRQVTRSILLVLFQCGIA